MENKTENHMTSAAAFVEGGIQESFDDACSICLEEFNNSDPSTVTVCRHEFHLQCVLEWCQRSSQCPMCWQPISLKDPTGRELFETVEQERKWRVSPSRNGDTFHHPTIRNFGFQSLHMEERMLHNLSIVASIERRHNFGSPITSNEDEPLQQTQQLQNENSSTSISNDTETNDLEMHPFSDTLKSRFNALSMRYKESISNGTKGLKERLFSRISSLSEFGLDARKNVNPETTSVSQSTKFVEGRENNRVIDTSLSSNMNHVEASGEDSSCNKNIATTSSTSSHSK